MYGISKAIALSKHHAMNSRVVEWRQRVEITRQLKDPVILSSTKRPLELVGLTVGLE